MNKDEILKAARQQKSKGKEYENHTAIKSDQLCGAVAVFLGIALFFFEYFISGIVDFGLIAVGLSAAATQLLYEGIKTKKAWMIICGSAESLIALFSILAFISKLAVI